LDDQEFDPPHRREGKFFLYATATRLTTGPAQPPAEGVPRSLSLGLKWPGQEVDHLLPVSMLRTREAIPHLLQHIFIAWY